MRSSEWTYVLVALFLSFCGCGGPGGSANPIPTQAPSNLSYTALSATYPIGTAIRANTPTCSGGAVASFIVTPTLPWGLSLDSTSGVIRGTPTVATAKASYTVTASNAGGSTSATLSIAVISEAPSALVYSSPTAVYTVDSQIMVNVPRSSGGEPTGYTMSPGSPALPAGLNLDPASGTISGTPETVSPASKYAITASNAFGSAVATLTITVDSKNATLRYSPSSVVYTVGRAIAPLKLKNRSAGSFSVAPPLPAGLSLNAVSGTISGTPSEVASTETYTVTASTSGGSAVGTVSITVNGVAPWAQPIPNMEQSVTPLAPAGSQLQQLNPDLPDNPAWVATHAASTAVSPDGSTLLVLTSGYNRVFEEGSDSLTTFNNNDSNEYVFVYDISGGAPVKKQVLQVPITYFGIAWDPSGTHFYLSGCSLDDVHIFSYTGSAWEEENAVPTKEGLMPLLQLGHKAGVGVGVYPCAAGIAISPSGKTMVVANYYNDSISVLTGGYGHWTPENVATGQAISHGDSPELSNLDLRPGKSLVSPASGTPGGEYPFWVVIQDTVGNDSNDANAVAYISSIRDREIDVVPLTDSGRNAPKLEVTARIAVKGQPNKMAMNHAQTLLYVAEDQSDTVDVIDINPAPTHFLTYNTVIETIPVLAPPGLLPSWFYYSRTNGDIANPIYTGANTNSLTLSPDGKALYVTNGNLNAVAVVRLSGTNSGDQVSGMIPTGWYPNSVSVNGAGTWMYVANAKSPTGPNPDWCYGYGPTSFQPNCFPVNQYNPQRTKAGLQSFPVPTASQLQQLTAQVAKNDRFSTAESRSDAQVMAAVRQGIKHVIYILKENRTYDQVLGDLVDAHGMPIGEQDPSLVQWGQAITPNLHSLARTFVTLDHFYATSEVSVDGWAWSTSARCTDVIEHEFPIAYAFRALSLEAEGLNRGVNVGLPTLAERLAADPVTPDDPDVLPGQTPIGGADGPNDEIDTGYLWNAALRAGLTVRNYGFFIDTTCYSEPACAIPVIHDPAATRTVVAHPTNAALAPFTDPYFRGLITTCPITTAPRNGSATSTRTMRMAACRP